MIPPARAAAHQQPAPSRIPLGLLALAAALRLAAWLAIPDTRFASDEDSYYTIAGALLNGRADIFWPPVTGWLIAMVRLVAPSDALAFVRLAWVLMDIACVAAVSALTARIAAAVFPDSDVDRTRLTWLATLGYGIYLPAISHAQFATSEIPALLQLLVVLLLLAWQPLSIGRLAAAGVLSGTLILTRTNLLPLLITLPVAMFMAGWSRRIGRDAAIYVAGASVVLGAQLYRNYQISGELTIATNSAYNLYLGNRDMYAEDLNLFHPRATAEQIEFRRQQFDGTLVYPSEPPAVLQRQALQWIADHPLEFSRRALGRLARLFAPRTDVLELVGGTQQSVLAPWSLLVLAAANLQWVIILAAGLTGIAWLRHRDRATTWLIGAVIGGAVPLCLIAISKPRYSFVFDPLLIVAAAAVLVMAPRRAWNDLTAGDRRWLLVAAVFLGWAWLAWTIFAVTSRLGR